ncbi:MAG: hypothetical protein GTN49_01020 [candidate division Zixibacteria bacterium]|nr:hypothetical protein [candidate division Zixibacteria bacterium]
MKTNAFLGIAISVAAAIPALSDYVYEGKWGSRGNSPGQFENPYEVALNPNGNVYVIDTYNNRVQYFTGTGSFLGRWGTYGSGNGEFRYPEGITVAPNGNVYVADTQRHRIQYFTAAGSFLGKWGTRGSGNGELYWPAGVAPSPTATRVYVADTFNYRIQYFRWTEPAVAPSSVGRIKALFR